MYKVDNFTTVLNVFFMDYAICTVSAAPVRVAPSHRTEMVNQILFGETMEVLQVTDEWIKVRTFYDGYEGWLTQHLVTAIDEANAKAAVQYVSTGLLNPVTLPEELINLPMGSSLTGYDEETRLLWDGLHKYHGTFRSIEKEADEDLLWRVLQPWMNAPYLWGGRTFMGVDCSGFVQVVYKVLGCALPRDASQQAAIGEEVAKLGDTKTGDLAFFINKEDKIVHVGIVLNNNKIMHASGKVRIDKLDEEGIINSETGNRTHQLYSLKSVIQF